MENFKKVTNRPEPFEIEKTIVRRSNYCNVGCSCATLCGGRGGKYKNTLRHPTLLSFNGGV